MLPLLVPSVALLGLVLQPQSPAARSVRAPRAGRVLLGWGPDPVWSDQSVESISDAGEGLKAITIDAALDGFGKGGQYLQIREPGAEKAGIFAIASAPGASPLEFLIKEQPPSDWSPGTGWLTGASAGAALEMSQAMGSGFLKTDDALEGISTVLLFAVGSGISPIRSVIESGALDGKSVELFYGARTPAMMSYTDKFAAWEELGVSVTPVISQPEGTGWEGCTGYVQDVAREKGIADPKATALLLCGMKGMAVAIKEMAEEAGIPEERVLANF